MNEYNEFVSNVSILKIFGERKPKIIDKHKKFLKHNLCNTFDEDFGLSVDEEDRPIEGALYLLFQMGPFYFFPFYLLKNHIKKIKIVLPEYSEETIGFLIEQAKLRSLDLSAYNFLDAGSVTGEMIDDALNNQESIVVFLDSFQTGEANERLPIKFGKTEINAFNVFLNKAYSLNYPIFRIISYWDLNKRRFNVKKVDGEKVSFSTTLLSIWTEFQELLFKYPTQWEGYKTIWSHLDLKLSELSSLPYAENVNYEFNDSNIKILYFDGVHALGAYVTAKIFSVSKELIEFVKTCIKDQTKFTLKELVDVLRDEDIVRLFVSNKIITKEFSH